MKVIPLPLYYEEREGKLLLTDTNFNFSDELTNSANFFSNFLTRNTGLKLKNEKFAQINFLLDFSLGEEEYRLDISEHSLNLSARTDRGAFYGVQTLIQLLDYENGKYFFPEIYIEDAPHFEYRGFMLDIVRHFFDKQEIMRLIELVSLHKFNYFHLHLTDDQGWRIESEKYPRLQEIASRRRGTILKNGTIDGVPHYGYLKKEELKEIVEYAKKHHLEVIPEIDMPGHMNALIAAYPELLCEGVSERPEVRTSWGISKNILCAGNEKTYAMLEDLLLEIIEIFPSRYIHLGGDEAPKNNWKGCSRCQQKIKQENLKDEEALQAYFMNHFRKFLEKHNKTVIGWNDGLHPDLHQDIIIEYWKPGTRKAVINAANSGRKVIMSDFLHLYLDYPYAMTPLAKTYAFEPLKGLERPENILGVEAPIWTEWVPNRDKLDFQVFPRLAAVAEIAWTAPELKDYDSFVNRLQHLYTIYQRRGVNYAKGKERKPNLLKRIIGTRKWWKNEDSEFLKD
jgi:hexosaminidase